MRWVGSKSLLPYGVRRWPTTGSPARSGYYAVRLWTLHPRYLDAKGLVALWREGLLAKKVLSGHTRGYRHHPQLERFRDRRRPEIAIAPYLSAVCAEAGRRGYHFDESKLDGSRLRRTIPETRGPLPHHRAAPPHEVPA